MIRVDVDRWNIAGLRDGRSYIEDVPSERLGAALERCSFTTRFLETHEAEAILVCVPTPRTRNRAPELGPLRGASRALTGVIANGQFVVRESTTFAGTTREHLVVLLEEFGLQPGEDFARAFSPGRVDAGRTGFTLRNAPKGSRRAHADMNAARSRALQPRMRHARAGLDPGGRRAAGEHPPAGKHRARQRDGDARGPHGIDVWEVMETATSKPFRFSRFNSGPGIGGYCLPVDHFSLTWKAREYYISTEFVELAGKVYLAMPCFYVEKLERALNHEGTQVRGATVLVVCVAYKGGMSDTRESPALKIIRCLRARGADVRHHDPQVVALPRFELQSTEAASAELDLAVIITVHPEVDHEMPARDSHHLLDLRGVTRPLALATTPRL